jgi:hypothetical protein
MQQVPASCPVCCPENYQQKELGLVPSKTILFLFNKGQQHLIISVVSALGLCHSAKHQKQVRKARWLLNSKCDMHGIPYINLEKWQLKNKC